MSISNVDIWLSTLPLLLDGVSPDLLPLDLVDSCFLLARCLDCVSDCRADVGDDSCICGERDSLGVSILLPFSLVSMAFFRVVILRVGVLVLLFSSF